MVMLQVFILIVSLGIKGSRQQVHLKVIIGLGCYYSYDAMQRITHLLLIFVMYVFK